MTDSGDIPNENESNSESSESNSDTKHDEPEQSSVDDQKTELLPDQIPSLSFSFPTREYTTGKSFLVPLPRCKNNLQFDTIDEAMTLILRHCLNHHGIMRRGLAKQYAAKCEVLDVSHGGYIIASAIPSKTFNKSFTRCSRQLQKALARPDLI